MKVSSSLRRLQHQHQQFQQQRYVRSSSWSKSNRTKPTTIRTSTVSNTNSIPIIRPILFTSFVCFSSFGFVAIKHYEEKQNGKAWIITRHDEEEDEQEEELSLLEKIRSIYHNHQKKKKNQQRDSNNKTFHFYDYIPNFLLGWYGEFRRNNIYVVKFIDSCEDIINDQTIGPIILTNIGLHFLFITIPSLRLIKARYFIHNMKTGHTLPMLLSTFAHNGIFHLGFNMTVLWIFGPYLLQHEESFFYHNNINNIYNHDYNPKEQFWAAYISAGTCASMGDIMFTKILQIIKNGKLRVLPGLGASGAISAIVALFCLLYPDIPVGIMFLPESTYLPAEQFLPILIAFDAIGLLSGVSPLGHGAHLGGTFAAIWAYQFDSFQMIQRYQMWVERNYHEIKKKINSN